jgi:hypothetical protein
VLRRLGLPADFLDHDEHFVIWPDRNSRPQADANDTHSAQPDQPGDVDDDNGPSMYDVRQMLRSGKVHPGLEGWVARNAGPLELVRQASTMPRYYMPLVGWATPPNLDELATSSYGFRQATDALTMRARFKLRDKDLSGAWDDLLATHRLARLLAQGATMNEQMAAVGIEEDAARAGIALATQGSLPLTQMKEVLRELAGMKPIGRIEDLVDHYERFVLLDAVGVWARGGEVREFRTDAFDEITLPHPSTLDYNQMLRDLNAWYDRITEKVNRTRRGHPDEPVSNISGTAAFRFLGEHSPPGKIGAFIYSHGGRLTRGVRTAWLTGGLLIACGPHSEIIWERADRARMAHEIETFAVALVCYHAERGRWPAKLEELGPPLMESIPTDRFSGRPLIYKPRPDGYLLYSIGEDRQDDGGQDKHQNPRADDIVAEVRSAESASRTPRSIQPNGPDGAP